MPYSNEARKATEAKAWTYDTTNGLKAFTGSTMDLTAYGVPEVDDDSSAELTLEGNGDGDTLVVTVEGDAIGTSAAATPAYIFGVVDQYGAIMAGTKSAYNGVTAANLATSGFKAGKNSLRISNSTVVATYTATCEAAEYSITAGDVDKTIAAANSATTFDGTVEDQFNTLLKGASVTITGEVNYGTAGGAGLKLATNGDGELTATFSTNPTADGNITCTVWGKTLTLTYTATGTKIKDASWA